MPEKSKQRNSPYMVPGEPRRKKIFLAEDDAFCRSSLRQFFSLQGFDVTLATNGTDAIDRLIGEEFDLAVIDYHLPRMDGVAIIRELEDRGLKVPVIMVTGDSDLATEQKVRSLSAAYFFVKPFSLDELKAVVEKILHIPSGMPANEMKPNAEITTRETTASGHGEYHG